MSTDTVILENSHGVQMREDTKSGQHYLAASATCECGEQLIVAPMIFQANHRKGDPVMVCGDHGVHGFRFKNLISGRQPVGSANRHEYRP